MIKQVVEIPAEDLKELKESQTKILSALEAMKIIKPPEYYTSEQFRDKTHMGTTQFWDLVKEGKLKCKKIGRKLFVDAGEVTRFFAGEIK